MAILSRTADPDAALTALVRLVEAADDSEDLLQAVCDDEGTSMRLLSVLGASTALADHLVRHPEHWRELRDPTLGSTRPAAYALREGLLEAVGADPRAPAPVATLADDEAVDALRVEYRRVLLRLAARDLAHDLAVDDAAAELSDLAAGTLEAALAIARQRVGESAALVRLSVIAMGKCGGHELNYVSDVDVIFVHEPVDGADEAEATRAATQLASHLMRVCSDQTVEGTIWPVDAALRPEGSAGPLTRTLASHRGYYERWAKTWEFQALLKARPVAGDLALGADYVDMVSPMVWQAVEREGFVGDTQAMRRRVLEHIPAREADRQLKLGSGGLRDVEFAVQLLQLVHGRTDETLRAPTTLSAIAQLTQGGYVGRDDGEALHESYAFLRTLEHRIQLHQLRRTHVVPADEESLRRLGRSMGFVKEPDVALDKAWQHHRREVRRLHEKLFYRPLLEAVAKIPDTDVRLSSEAAGDRLAALGYSDPAAALRNLEALTSGVTRTANIQKALLPAMLQWFAECADPDAGLFGFRRISEALRPHAVVPQDAARRGPGGRAAGPGARHLPLRHDPAGDRAAGRADPGRRAHAAARRRADRGDARLVEPAGRRREGGARDPGGTPARAVPTRLGGGARPDRRRRRGRRPVPTHRRHARGDPGLGEQGRAGAARARRAAHPPGDRGDGSLRRLRALLRQRRRRDVRAPAEAGRRPAGRHGVRAGGGQRDPAPPGPARRRPAAGGRRRTSVPEGKQGALVRTLDSYAAYYAKWSKVWEFQALLRADAVVGDPELRDQLPRADRPAALP